MEFTKKLAESAISSAEEESWKLEGIYESFDKFNFNSSVREKLWNLYYEKSSDNPHLTQEKFFCYLYDSGVCDILNSCYTKKSEISKKENINHSSIIKEATLRVAELYPILNNIDYEKITDSEVGEFQNKLILNSKKAKILGDVLDDREDAETIPKSHEEYIALVKKISAETDSFITKNRISINNIISLCQNIRNLALNKTEANSNYKNSERELSAIKITIDGQGRDFYGSVVKYGVKYSKYGEDDYFQRVAGGNNIGSDEFKEFRKKALTAILERYNKEKTALDTARESGDMLQRLNLISETFRMLYLGHFLSDGNSEICYLMLNMMLHENNLPLYRSHELTAASEFNQGNISPYFLADLMQKDLMRGMEDYIKKADENDLIQSKDYLQRKENFYKLYKTTELQKKERGDIEKNLEIEKDKMKKSSDTDIGEFLKKKLSRTKEKIANKEDYILGKSDKITGDGLNKERKTHKRKTREGLKNYINYLKSKGTEESEIAKDTVIEELFKKLKTIEKDNYNKSDNDSKKKIAAVNNIIHESGSYEYWKKFLELDDIYVRPDLEENVKNIGEKYVGKGDLGKITQRIERVNNKNEFNTSHGYNKIQHHRSSINSTYHAEIIKRLKSHYKDLDDDNIDPDSDKELQDFYKALYGILEKQLEDGKLNIKGAESIFDTVSEVNKEAMADFLRFCVSKSNDDNSVKNRLREILFDNFQVQKKQWEQEAETLPDQKSSPDSKEAAEDQKSPSSSQASDKISEINKNLFFNSFDILKKEFINSEEKEHYEGKEHLILYFLKHRRFAEIKTLLVDLVGSDKRNELLADKINCVKYDSANPANPDNQTLLNKNIIEWALEFGYKEGEFNTLLALGFRPEQSADHKFGNRKITKIKERRSELGKSLDKYFVEVSPGNPSNDALKNILKYMQEFKDNPDELWQFLIFNEVTNPNYNISAQSNLDKLVIILESSADKSNKNEILKLLIKNISLKAGEDEKDDLSQEGFKKISKMAKRAMLSDPRIFKETLKEKGLKAIAQDLGSELNSFPVYDIQAVYAKKTLDALSKITTFEENKSPDTLKNNGDYISLKKQFYYNYILNQDLVEDPRITEKENDFLKTILTGNINGLKFTKANGEEVDISKTINNLVATKFKDIKNIDIVKRMILEQRLDLFKDRINDSDSSYSSFITALPDEYNNLKDVTPDSIIKTNNQNNETSALSYKEGEKIILPSSGRVQEILNNIATQDGRKEIFEKTNGKISNLIHGPHVNQVEKTPNHLDLTLHLNKNQTFTINTQLDNYSSYKLCVTLDCKGSITGEVYFKDINNNRVANDNSVRTLLSDLPADYQLDIHAGGNNKVIKWDDISQKITNPYPKTSPQNPSSPPINNQAATNNTSSPTTISI